MIKHAYSLKQVIDWMRAAEKLDHTFAVTRLYMWREDAEKLIPGQSFRYNMLEPPQNPQFVPVYKFEVKDD
jgi:hypothetical protein